MGEFRAYSPAELGPDGYPFEWHQTLKHEVRQLAGHRCVRCGHPYETGKHGSGEWSPCDERCAHFHYPTDVTRWEAPLEVALAYPGPGAPGFFAAGGTAESAWRILTVHHLDGDKANCRWWNLVALDQRCHLQVQGRVRMERTWPWNHSEWFEPYVAGFYAWTYLGEDLSRPEVESRLKELLALERVA